MAMSSNVLEVKKKVQFEDVAQVVPGDGESLGPVQVSYR